MPVVYLIDERVSNPHAILASIPKADIGFLITSYMSVSEVVTVVIDGLAAAAPLPAPSVHRGRGQSAAAPMITSLRILAFGNCDELLLGWGIHTRNAAQLAPLSSHLRAGASGECLLFGCNVALGVPRPESFLGGAATGQRFGSSSSGWKVDEHSIRQGPSYRLLHAIARSLGVPATAGLDTQTSAFDWLFAGATMTVEPFGEMSFTGMDTPASL